jgi:translation initiation factor 5B
MNSEGKQITEVKQIQADKETVDEAEKGKQVAVSMPEVTVGRQINENFTLYSAIPEEDFRKLKDLKKLLTPEEIETIKEIAEIKRRDHVVWGV